MRSHVLSNSLWFLLLGASAPGCSDESHSPKNAPKPTAPESAELDTGTATTPPADPETPTESDAGPEGAQGGADTAPSSGVPIGPPGAALPTDGGDGQSQTDEPDGEQPNGEEVSANPESTADEQVSDAGQEATEPVARDDAGTRTDAMDGSSGAGGSAAANDDLTEEPNPGAGGASSAVEPLDVDAGAAAGGSADFGQGGSAGSDGTSGAGGGETLNGSAGGGGPGSGAADSGGSAGLGGASTGNSAGSGGTAGAGGASDPGSGGASGAAASGGAGGAVSSGYCNAQLVADLVASSDSQDFHIDLSATPADFSNTTVSVRLRVTYPGTAGGIQAFLHTSNGGFTYVGWVNLVQLSSWTTLTLTPAQFSANSGGAFDIGAVSSFGLQVAAGADWPGATWGEVEVLVDSITFSDQPALDLAFDDGGAPALLVGYGNTVAPTISAGSCEVGQ